MALKRSFTEEDFTCPVCVDVFNEPVLLTCGHSACKNCIQSYWRTDKHRKCPVCRTRSIKDPPLNLALRNLCQTFQEVRGDPKELCELHGESLKLFCVEDAQLACLVCRDSSKHLHHQFRPVDEAAVELKSIVKAALKPLTLNLKNLQDAQSDCNQTIEYIEQQATNIKNRIDEEFRKLNQFLKDEKAAMVTALMEEKKERKLNLQSKCNERDQEIKLLSETIKDIKKELHSEDLRFIKDFEKILEKSQQKESTLGLVSREVIDTAKYLGNLQFNVWEKMQNIISYTPIVLDPNTAHSQLMLSADLTSVRDSDDDNEEEVTIKRPPFLEMKQRFCVLGSEGFSTGIHCWDVEVENSTFWMLGVTTESVRGKECPGAWGIGYDSKQLCARSPIESYKPLTEAAIPRTVRVCLDWNAGEVWFLDAATKAFIHMFSHPFTEKVFPFFQTLCSLSPLKILPLQPSVVVRKLH